MNDSTDPRGGTGPATTVDSAAPSQTGPHGVAQARSLFDREILAQAIIDSFKKLDPRVQIRNPVMFVVLVGTVITSSSR